MNSTRTYLALAAASVALLAPSAASAAPAKIGVKPNASGVAVKVANPNRYAIRGSVALVAGKRSLASARASVRARSAKTLQLRARGGATVTVVTRIGRKGARPTVVRRSVRLTTSGSGSAPATQGGFAPSSIGGTAGGSTGGGSASSGSGSGGATGGGSTPPPAGGNPDPAPGTHWIGNDGSGHTFGFSAVNGVVSLDSPVLMGVLCQEGGGSYRWAWSDEVFDLYSGWALGNQSGTQTLDTPRVNMFAGSSPHRVTYRIATSQNGDSITGSIYQSFAFSRFDNMKTTFFNCSGTVNFTATRG